MADLARDVLCALSNILDIAFRMATFRKKFHFRSFGKVLNTPLLAIKLGKLKNIFIGGDIDGQSNATDYHQLNKNVCCKKEM